MDQKTPYETHGKIMHRIAKSDSCIYGATPASTIPVDKPSIVAFGGERTKTIKDANYYASMLVRLIGFYGIKGVEIYSAYYDFDTEDRTPERTAIFRKARAKLSTTPANQPIENTQYINDLYNIVIRPRIIDNAGEKLPDFDALRNIRHIILFTHSHGSVPVRAFQDIMFNDMRQSGYAPQVIRKIMQNLLVIQHAPVSPLEKSRFNTVSFMSANDTKMNFHNQFSEYVAAHNEDMLPSYFQLGNFFATYGFTYQLLDEHQITGLDPNKNQDMLTPDGAMIMAAERNTIINGINAMLGGSPLPKIDKLIAPILPTDTVHPDFETLASNGEFFMRIMRHDLHQERASHNR